MTVNLPASVPRPASLDAVFAHAWTCAEFTATDAIAATGLTRSTTIEAMESLAEIGLLRELPNAREAGAYRKGRPARRFELRGDAGMLVGVDAGNAHLTVMVTDLRSSVRATGHTERTPDLDDGPTRVTRVLAAVDDALAAAGCAREDVLALCAGVPAPVDSRGRSPRGFDGFWNRMNPDLVDALSWAPLVRIDNDASLAALAEGAAGAAVGCRNYIVLLAGARLGAGVVVDGQILRGTHGGVGEMRAFDHVNGVGTAAGLGATAAQWAAHAVADGSLSPGSALRRVPASELNGRILRELAAAGDVDAGEIVDRIGVMLGRIASVLASVYDPEKIIVSGGIEPVADRILATARRAFHTDLDLPAPELLSSQLGADIVAHGAIASAAASAQTHALDLWQVRGPAGLAAGR
ncbi:MAG: ROK family protein [Microbacterium sp.]